MHGESLILNATTWIPKSGVELRRLPILVSAGCLRRALATRLQRLQDLGFRLWALLCFERVLCTFGEVCGLLWFWLLSPSSVLSSRPCEAVAIEFCTSLVPGVETMSASRRRPRATHHGTKQPSKSCSCLVLSRRFSCTYRYLN